MATSNINVRTSERWASALGGAVIAAFGVRRLVRDGRAAGALLTSAGAGLIWRGATGHCAVYEAAGIDRSNDDTRTRLSGSRGVNVEEAVTINAAPNELYSLWRDLEWLPAIVPDLISVQLLDRCRSRWVAKGPGGRRVVWTAEIFNEIPGEMMAWRTVGKSDVVSAGSVHFDPAPGLRGTMVRVRLQYDPPGGKVGAALAWAAGRAPEQSIHEGLRHFKQLIEAGELPRNQPQPRGAR